MCDILKYCLVSTLLSLVHSGNILGIFHYGSKSHYILGSTLLRSLAKRGHNATMVSPFKSTEVTENYNELILNGILETDAKKKDQFFSELDSTITGKILLTKKILDTKLQYVNCLKHEVFQNILRGNDTYDLVIQFWAMSEAFVGIGEHFGAPTIGFSPISGNFHINYLLNGPSNPAYIPNHLLPFSDKMSVLQKIVNIIVNFSIDLYLKFYAMPYQKRIYNEVFPRNRPFEEALDNVDLFFINSHVSTEAPRPYLPNTIQIGGFHVGENKILPKDLKEYLDNSTEGVIYFSLGSNVRSSQIPRWFKDAFIQAFKRIRMNVLWKFEEQMDGLPDNVKIKSWLPQRDILAHKNVKLFITHGGFGSVTEAIYFGVPFIGIPFYLDQESNIATSVEKGIALGIQYKDISEETLTLAIREMLENEKYRNNMNALSSLCRNQPVKPLDKAIFWVEYLMKHKSLKYLKTYGSKMSFYEFYFLDVIITIFIFFFTLFLCLKFIMYFKYNASQSILAEAKLKIS